jgi:hypothetical protein
MACKTMLHPCRVKPVEVVADDKHPRLYRVRWADGVLSRDCYDRSRADDVLRRYDGYRHASERADARS